MSNRPDIVKNGVFELGQIGVRPEDLTFGAQLFNGLARYALPDARERKTGILNGWGCAIYDAYLADIMLRGGLLTLEEITRRARGVGITPDVGAEPLDFERLATSMGLKALVTTAPDSMSLAPYFKSGAVVAINYIERNPDVATNPDVAGHWGLGVGIDEKNGELLVLNSSHRPDKPGRKVYGIMVMPGDVYQLSGWDTDGIFTPSGSSVYVNSNTTWFDHEVVVLSRK